MLRLAVQPELLAVCQPSGVRVTLCCCKKHTPAPLPNPGLPAPVSRVFPARHNTAQQPGSDRGSRSDGGLEQQQQQQQQATVQAQTASLVLILVASTRQSISVPEHWLPQHDSGWAECLWQGRKRKANIACRHSRIYRLHHHPLIPCSRPCCHCSKITYT